MYPRFILLLACGILPGADPAYETLSKAYESLKLFDYSTAIDSFRQSIVIAPGRTDIRKDLAYTLLKVGRSAEARDVFGDAMTIDPDDQHLALEFAFLCHETGKSRQARLVFDRVRKLGNATAEQAFQNVDRPLADGIARWTRAVELEPSNFSAHHELARLAAERSDWALAARHFETAFQLKPAERALLIDLGLAWKELGKIEESRAALLAASRGLEPRTAEAARELLGKRYPYVYEFRKALELDPANIELRRELGYLLYEMGDKEAAQKEFRLLEPKSSARDMAERSYAAGFMHDALRYLTIAHEDNPADHEVMLKLGYTHNMLKDDRKAVEWFALARLSADPTIAAAAHQAYSNLKPHVSRRRTTAWLLPFYSSRWKDAFAYGQIKTEFRAGALPLRPYVSMRLIGDARGKVAQPYPQYLSEKAAIFGVGVASPYYKGVMAWAEAGQSFSYAQQSAPDYRGGVSYSRGFGRLLGAATPGTFLENHEDAVYVSRFANSVLFYTQNKIGYTLMPGFQLYWNLNLTADAKRQYWANFAEAGPGLRARFSAMPPGLVFSVDVVRGAHTINAGNPRRPNFYDVRAGFWYAITR